MKFKRNGKISELTSISMSSENKNVGIGSYYDKLYVQSERPIFNYGEPEQVVKSILAYKQSGSVLDLGAGDGRHARFLADKGFDVRAVDVSGVGIAKLEQWTDKNSISMETGLADILKRPWTRDYDVLISSFVLQHIQKDEAKVMIQEMQKHTVPEGLNVISWFIDEGDAYDADTEKKMAFFSPGEMESFYEGWTVLRQGSEPATMAAKRPDGTNKKNMLGWLLVQKKNSDANQGAQPT